MADRLAEAVGVLLTVAVVALLVFALWLHFWGPCEWLWWSSTKELPARCLGYYAR